MAETEIRCGTRAGSQRHRRLAEPVCDPCRLAWNAYMRGWKAARNSEARIRRNAERRAKDELSRRYQREYARLVADYLKLVS